MPGIPVNRLNMDKISSTGTGSEQTLPHNLGRIPDGVLYEMDDTSDTDIAMGAHTGTACLVTVTNGKVFRLLPYLFTE